VVESKLKAPDTAGFIASIAQSSYRSTNNAESSDVFCTAD
jgi:hypothetical protein